MPQSLGTAYLKCWYENCDSHTVETVCQGSWGTFHQAVLFFKNNTALKSVLCFLTDPWICKDGDVKMFPIRLNKSIFL